MTLHTPITSALEDAEHDLAAACHAADIAFYNWLRDRTPESEAAWSYARSAESGARQAVRELELAMDASEGIYAA